MAKLLTMLPRVMKSACLVADPEPTASGTAEDFPSVGKKKKSKAEGAVLPPLPDTLKVLYEAGADPKTGMTTNTEQLFNSR